MTQIGSASRNIVSLADEGGTWEAADFLAVGAVVARKNGPSSVPVEFGMLAAIPGAQVRLRHVPVTVRHADCDLTGVGISYRNNGGAYVPQSAGGIGNSGGFELTVRPGSLDVTISAPKGPPGNA